jgi:hypothetical protein
MMEAARTSETSVDNYFTRQYIPEDTFELHTRRRENLKSHKIKVIKIREDIYLIIYRNFGGTNMLTKIVTSLTELSNHLVCPL